MNVWQILNWNLNFLENLRKPLTFKSTRKRMDIDFLKGFSYFCALARSQKYKTSGFAQKTRYRTHRFAIRAISFFRVNVI